MEKEIRLDITPLFFPEHTRRADDLPVGLDEISKGIERQFTISHPEVSLNDYDVKVETYGKGETRAWIMSTACSEKLLFEVSQKAAKELYPGLNADLDYNYVSSDLLAEEVFVVKV